MTPLDKLACLPGAVSVLWPAVTLIEPQQLAKADPVRQDRAVVIGSISRDKRMVRSFHCAMA